jgi:hypothetical protein
VQPLVNEGESAAVVMSAQRSRSPAGYAVAVSPSLQSKTDSRTRLTPETNHTTLRQIHVEMPVYASAIHNVEEPLAPVTATVST